MLGRALRKSFSFAHDERFNIRGIGYATSSGSRVSSTSAMQASSVYSATTLIADTLSSLPLKVLRRDDVQRVPQRPPEAAALRAPNPLQTTPAFVQSVVLSLLLWGEAFIRPRRTNAGRVFELWPLDPGRITEVKAEESGDSVAVKFSISDLVPGQDAVINAPGRPPELIHVPYHQMPGQLRGISPIENQAELIGMSLSALEHAGRFLGDGVHLTGVIETPHKLDRKQATDLHEGFRQMHSGSKRAGGVGVLTGGATFKTMTIPPVELQFLEQMQYSDRKIAAIYRVPPHMLGDVERSTSWGTGIEEQTIQFVQHTLVPLAIKIESALNAGLLAGTDYEIKFAFQGLLRGSSSNRAEFYTKLWSMGVLNADAILALEDMAPLPGRAGQGFYVPLNFTEVGAMAGGVEGAARQRILEALLPMLAPKGDAE